MDPLSASLLVSIGVSLISVAAVALIIVAETRDDGRPQSGASAGSIKERLAAEPTRMDFGRTNHRNPPSDALRTLVARVLP